MPINVAVVGLGKMGLSHLAIANALEDINVVAICDNAPLVGGVIEKYGGYKHYSDYNAMLEKGGLDALIIATPSSSHVSMVREALQRNLHVFCEKPLTLSSADSLEISKLAEERGLVAQVGYHNRFVATFGEARALIAEGVLGRVTHVLAEAYGPVVLRPTKPTWRGKANQGGGCLYDYAAHPINLVNWMFGEPQSCKAAELKRGFSKEVDDEVYAMLRFDGGVTAQVSVNWSDPSVRKMTTRLSIWGERGKIFVDRQELQVFLTEDSANPAYKRGWTVRNITELTPPVSFYLRGEEYSAQLEAFAAAAVRGGSEVVNSFRSGAETDRTIELIRDASEGKVSSGQQAEPVRETSRRGGFFGFGGSKK